MNPLSLNTGLWLWIVQKGFLFFFLEISIWQTKFPCLSRCWNRHYFSAVFAWGEVPWLWVTHWVDEEEKALFAPALGYVASHRQMWRKDPELLESSCFLSKKENKLQNASPFNKNSFTFAASWPSNSSFRYSSWLSLMNYRNRLLRYILRIIRT